MAFQYIEQDDLLTAYEDAKTFALPLFQPFAEYERIARNQPHPGIAPNLPKVTDGTLASIIQEQPKRVIQQIPSGKIISNDRWLEIVAEYLLQHEIIPNANQGAALIQKCWALVSKALTYGSQPAYVQFVNRGDYFGTDFTLPYIRDVLLEPGKLSDRDSNVIFLRSWWSKSQIKALLAKEELLTQRSITRKDKEKYTSGWKMENLKKLLDSETSQKDALQQTPAERNKQVNRGFYEIVHAFQRGAGANFYSFSPHLDKEDNLLRTKVNPDPRGIIPIHFMYANVDLSNPYGRGSVEISGGMQNLLDSEVQTYQYMRALTIDPPLEVRGSVVHSTIKFAPHALWRMGVDPANSVTPAKLETATLQQFPQNYGLIKGQIMALNGQDDNSTAASSGNASSKTPQGVDANQMRLGLSDNYVRRQFEAVFEEILNTMLSLYFAERAGTQELTVDIETADKLKELEKQPGEYVNPQNQIMINYDDETPKLEFKADPTSSTAIDNQEQIQALQELLTNTTQNPYVPYLLQAEKKELHIGEVYQQLFERYGIKDIDKIITDMQVDEQGNPVKPPTVMTPFFDKPKLAVQFKDLPPAAQVQALANGGINVQLQDVLQPNIEQMAGGGTRQNPVAAAAIDPRTGQIMRPEEPPIPGITHDATTGAPLVPAQPNMEQPDLSNHPLVKLMETLQIKFTDLPSDSQHELLQLIGLPSTQDTPTSQTQQLKMADTAIKAGELAHKQKVADNAHLIAASNAAVSVANLKHQENVANAQASQAQASHDLAVKQANKPVGVSNG